MENEAKDIRIHAFIICWSGMEDNARHIARSIHHLVDELSVVYSNKNDTIETGAGNWIQVPDTWFFGKKFQTCLQLHTGGILLQIQADAASDNWPALVNHCKSAYAQFDNIGVWAPNVDYTWWTDDRVLIRHIESSKMVMVAQTDCTVWSFSENVLQRLRAFDYDHNNFGWGIDWVAIAYSVANHLLVLRDMSITIKHRQETGYKKEEAEQQMNNFFKQMTPSELEHYGRLKRFVTR